jgi:hypothetical protein
MSVWKAYLDDVAFSFRKQKEWAEQAMVQLREDEFFRRPGEHSNSAATIVKHLAGNLRSRWTDFMTTDGEKPWRDRDDEFVIAPNDTREALMAAWEAGWGAVLGTVAGLGEDNLLKVVTIRGEGHTVLQALHRALTHAAYHTGQILYVARLVRGGEDWRYITIPPGQSRQARERGGQYLK